MGKSKTEERKSGCPVAYTLDIIGDKWSLLIIRDLAFFGKKHYGEFLDSMEKIATNILAERLKRLEEADIISRQSDPENRRKYIYELTQKGRDLIPVMRQVVFWGAKYDPDTVANERFMNKVVNTN